MKRPAQITHGDVSDTVESVQSCCSELHVGAENCMKGFELVYYNFKKLQQR